MSKRRRKSEADKAFAEFKPIVRGLIRWLGQRWWGVFLLIIGMAGLLNWLVSPFWAWTVFTLGVGIILLYLIFQRDN